jgi:flagellar protein FliO/FliZ
MRRKKPQNPTLTPTTLPKKIKMEIDLVIRAVFALIFVVALIGGTAWAFQKFALGKNFMNNGAPKRMKIVEYLMLDAKRKLVLVKKDKEEILLLLGDSSQQVISTTKTK